MSGPGEELGTAEEQVDWSAALSESLSNNSEVEAEGEAEKESPEALVEESEKDTDTSTVETEDETVEESEDAPQPLESWSDEVKTYFQSLDNEGRQFILDRHKELEGDYTRKTQELADIRKRYERLDDVLKPYDEIARAQGLDLAPHVASALQYYVAFQRDPLSVVKHLVTANQITPEQLGLGQKEDDDTDPTIGALRSELESTKREIASLKQGTQATNQAALNAQISEFRDAKDEQGNPKHPHFEQVRPLMAALVNQGKSLQDAYDAAVWAVPEFREASQAEARKKAEEDAKRKEKERQQKAEKERQEKLKKAKAAETLGPSDTDQGKQKGEFKGWDKALMEELSHMQE